MVIGVLVEERFYSYTDERREWRELNRQGDLLDKTAREFVSGLDEADRELVRRERGDKPTRKEPTQA